MHQIQFRLGKGKVKEGEGRGENGKGRGGEMGKGNGGRKMEREDRGEGLEERGICPIKLRG